MAATGNTPKPQGQTQAEVKAAVEGTSRRGIVRVVRRPRRSTWLYWLTAATSDIANSVERTNAYLEQDRPAKAAEAFIDVFSPRRLAVLLPGGSVLRGARRPPAPVPSAMPSTGRSAEPIPVATPDVNKS